jgi:hypothetical protein
MLAAVALCSLAVGVRACAVFQISASEWTGTENERVAAALGSGRGWVDAFAPGTGPTAHVAPAYPLLLSFCYRLFGSYDSATGRLAQVCLSLPGSTGVILLLPLVAKRLQLSPAAGWSGAFLAAWLPANLWSEVSGHHEQVFATLAVLILLLVFAGLQRHGWSGAGRAIRAGLLLGLAGLISPNVLLAPALFWVVEAARRRNDRVALFRSGLVMLTVALVVVAPWLVRNYLALGGFAPIRSNFGLELAVGNRPEADGKTYAPGFAELHPLSSPEERERLVRLGELGYMKEKQRQAVAWIVDHPARFGWLTLRRIWLFWFTPEERWCSLEPRFWFSYRVYGILGLGVLLELVRLIRNGHPSAWLLACTFLGLGAPYFLTHVELRYRLPVVGLSAVLTCSWVVASARSLRGCIPARTDSPVASSPKAA